MEAQINNQYICHKNSTELLYFILGRVKLGWNFFQYTKDGSDIYRYSNRKWVLTLCFVGNLWISEASFSKVETFQHCLALPNIKYNSPILFLDKCIGYLLMLPNIFLINHHGKTQSELIDAIRNFQKWMLFCQCAVVLFTTQPPS